jgi:hypothetical protein
MGTSSLVVWQIMKEGSAFVRDMLAYILTD